LTLADPEDLSYSRQIHPVPAAADGTGQTQLTNSETPEPTNVTAGEHGPAWSSDGERIAYIGTTPDSSAIIFVMNADGSGETQLTTGRAVIPFSGKPAWSPNGTTIAYADWTSGHQGIFLINADGSGVTRLTDGTDAGAAWSPDGTKIAFVRTLVGRGDDVYVVNTDGSGLTRLTRDPGDSRHYLAWSPDGTKITFELGGNIYLVNGNGTGLTQLTFGPRADLPAFRQDGSKIAYYLSDVTQNQLYLMNLDGSGETPLSPAWSLGRPSSPAAWRP
jgi:Tol biopolymer transport system component